MKGIILAGGSGTRLYPLTRVISKQLIPVYDKPMIYYPMSVLMLAGIRDILIISTPQDLPRFEELFGDGAHLGLNLNYAVQPRPEGLAQAFLIGEQFINGDSVCLVLGDNIFFGHNFAGIVRRCASLTDGGIIFGYLVKDPQRYGVVEFDGDNRVIGIEEKPSQPRSNYAVTGLYFYDGMASDYAAELKPSPRGELEITDLNKCYLDAGTLYLEQLGRGYAWLDTGTHQSLLEASNFIETIQTRQGLQVCCPEEIAFGKGWINVEQLEALAKPLIKNNYGQYLQKLAQRGIVP